MKKLKIIFLTIVGLIDFVLCQGEANMTILTQTNINIEQGVDFVVTDRFGRKKGFDPRSGGRYYDSLPNASYGYDNAMGATVIDFALKIFTPQDDGIWMIQLIGDTLCKFDFYVSVTSIEGSQKIRYNKNIFIDKDAVLNYKFTYYGTPGSPAKVEKIISITSLGQDITTGGKLNLVGNQAFVNSLNAKCSQMVNFYNAGNKAQAHNKLNEIKSNIQSAYNTPTGDQFVNEYAYNVLVEDISLTFNLIDYHGTIEEQRIRK